MLPLDARNFSIKERITPVERISPVLWGAPAETAAGAPKSLTFSR